MATPSSSLILPVPHLQQPASGECLPACAAMALTYVGIRVNYRQLLRLLQTQVGYGTPFSNIRTLTKLKVSVTYKQGQLADIRRYLQADAPVLVPVQTRELPHWVEDTPHAVVVVGMDAQRVYINDPGFPNAPIAVSHGDFDLAWLEHNEYYAVLAP
jgi:ABC-type bacteriocin/lantibiotic exporter with double-glycine peptidase domain